MKQSCCEGFCVLCFVGIWSSLHPPDIFISALHFLPAAPEFHRFILKVRRMKHLNYGVPGGAAITMGYFRLERLFTGWSVASLPCLVSAEVASQSGR